ncbi:type IV-A pilus assembly ATPase PilB [Frateuria aurantia]|uniref:Type IV-A pilus assembly ATPase PilB n=1 Tax=Frateuria aurantia (strain ATCC 33424 / DSM 6220 / KCTC 2777 / LMG 1558 / NBRC 3245 / NCIMB 13370) TaxID=767434 RepID=H8L4F9_FRAAD|nr:type IV-A pilus assembly ATPase PilB [Frateuria aurantia]AFC85633.1 type IV-A pilus assembly ATPase PilB [Frateuria aurantia DSM 6220]
MSTQFNHASSPLRGLSRRLVDEGLMSEDAIRHAMAEANTQRQTLVSWLQDRQAVDSLSLSEASSREFGIPLVDLAALDMPELPAELLNEALISKHQALPIMRRNKRLYVAIADPMQSHVIDEFKFQSSHIIEPLLVEHRQLQQFIHAAVNKLGAALPHIDDSVLSELEHEYGDQEESISGIDANAADDAPIVKFVNKILLDAIRRGASDIHFEPFEQHYRIRLRLDGLLIAVASPPPKLAPRLSSRLKVMAGLDIAERRVPQDGRIKLNLSRTQAMDFRVSTLPTLFGEKIVLRILDGSSAKLGIDKLGYEEFQKRLYLDAIHKPYGMVLVTGPTGSGKTVSLYTALNILNTDERNISTVEDPVEIRVEGINQVEQNAKRGMTFAAALRSFLRQDPDVIMVGEIRDVETAEIAIKAAQTGHMVLSTLHTNDAPQTIARLMNMGIAPYNIISSVTLVIAQRLARRLHSCKRPVELPRHALLAEGFSETDIDAGLTIYEPVGCEQCNGGYKGRVGIYQVMPLLENIQQIILRGGGAMQIAEAAAEAGIPDLRESALSKVKAGIISLAEMARITKD